MVKGVNYYTTGEVANIFGLSQNTVRRWIREGRASTQYVEVYGGGYLIHPDQVDRWRAALGGKSPRKGWKLPFPVTGGVE